MGAITPQFLMTLEDNMRVLTENQYASLSASGNLWYRDVAKIITSVSRKELLFWFLSTAQIKDEGYSGGNMRFDELAMLQTSYENKDSGNGFEISVNELSDLDGKGVKAAAKWSTDTGHQIAYHPQEQVSSLILAGESDLGYDGVAFFSKLHPYNPFNSAAGVYGNLFKDAYNGSTNPTYYAAPIDATVNVDVALNNLMRVYATIRTIKQANGIQPRFLKPVALLHPPQLTERAVQLTNAKLIAQAAGTSGGGGADVEAIIRKLGIGQPVEVPEFSAEPTNYYVLCEWQSASEMGPIVYQNREPYRITYYTGQGGGTGVDAILDRAKKLEWHNWGRNTTGYGHPFYLFKICG
jgi:phage major head subunit gpT-like protein